MPAEMLFPEIYTPFVQVPRRYKVICGGRGSAKSRFYALMACKRVSEGVKVVCAREYQSSIRHSVYALIKDTITRYGLQGFEVQRSTITHVSGGEMVFIGLGLNPDSARSLEGAGVCWVEEAQFITMDTLDTLRPSIRGDNSEIWLSGNLLRQGDPFSKRFVQRKLPFKFPEFRRVECDHLYMRVHTTFADNPFFPEVLELERADDELHLDTELYNHVWGGMYCDSVDNAIIKAEWFNASIDAHKTWRKFGLVTCTHDPADSHDPRATVIRHGNTILKWHEEKRLDINDSFEQACEMAMEHNASAFIWDATGVGLGLRRQADDFFRGGVALSEFHGAAATQNPDHPAIMINETPVSNSAYFSNLRAQLYCQLAERFRKTYQAVKHGEYIDPHELISIDSNGGDVDSLRSELCSIPRKLNAARSYQLLSKSEMKNKLKVESPNIADCVMMSELEMEENTDWFNKPTEQRANIQVA